jgi:hypothetical protein
MCVAGTCAWQAGLRAKQFACEGNLGCRAAPRDPYDLTLIRVYIFMPYLSTLVVLHELLPLHGGLFLNYNSWLIWSASHNPMIQFN